MKKTLLFLIIVYISINSLAQNSQDTSKTSGLFTIGSNIDLFNEPYKRIHLIYPIGVGYKGPNTTLIGYLNVGNLIQETTEELKTYQENQFELDFYHKLSKTTNYWLNYAYSDAPHFPKHRAMARIWQSLGSSGFRTSVGGKYYYFNEDLFTATIALEKYQGNIWIEGKIYTYFKDPNTRFSYQLNSRFFWNDVNYISLSVMTGAAQDEPWISYDVLRANTVVAGITSFIDKEHKSQIRANIGYSTEEYSPYRWRNRFLGSLSFTFYMF
jgi:YaiO family outer membrane protein